MEFLYCIFKILLRVKSVKRDFYLRPVEMKNL